MKTAQKISIFISSTFDDMHHERDIIKDIITPSLNSYYLKQGININVIDLRWGVNTVDINEVNKQKQVLKACLSEIDKEPSIFIALLGDRYGWIPDASSAEDAGYSVVLSGFSANPSITEMEIVFALHKKQNKFDEIIAMIRKDESAIDKDVDLENLKAGIKECLCRHSKNYIEYDRANDADFIRSLEDRIKTTIETKFNENLWRLPSDKVEELELSQDILFATLDSHFIGRDGVVDRIVEACKSGNNIVVSSCLGLGKSTIFFKILTLLSQEGATVLPFSASNNECVDINDALLLWNSWISNRLGVKYLYTPKLRAINLDSGLTEISSEDKIRNDFLTLVKDHSKNHPTTIAIDSVENFKIEDLKWLMQNIPDKVNILFTVDDSSETYCELHKFPKNEFIRLPGLNYGQTEELITYLGLSNSKQIYRSVLSKLIVRSNAENSAAIPLWIVMSAKIIFSLGANDYKTISSRAESTYENKIVNFLLDLVDELPSSVEKLFCLFVDRINCSVGNGFVRKVIGYIVFSENGIRKSDIVLLLGKKWSDLNFSILTQLLSFTLVDADDTNLWVINNSKLKHAIAETFSEDEIVAVNRDLYLLFSQLKNSDKFKEKYYIPFLARHNDYEEMAQYFTEHQESLLNQDVYEGIVRVVSSAKDNGIIDRIAQSEIKRKHVVDLFVCMIIHDKLPLETVTYIADTVVAKCSSVTQKYNMELSMALVFQGDFATTFDAKLKCYTDALKYVETFENKEISREDKIALSLPMAYDKLSFLYEDKGDLETAKSYALKAHNIIRHMFERYPSDINSSSNYCSINMRLGDYLSDEGNDEEAEYYYNLAKEATCFIGNKGEESMVKIRVFCHTAEYYERVGVADMAFADYQRALDTINAIHAQNYNDELIEWKELIYWNIAKLYRKINDITSAIRFAELYYSVLEKNPKNTCQDYYNILLKIEKWHEEDNNFEQAYTTCQRIHALCMDWWKQESSADAKLKAISIMERMSMLCVNQKKIQEGYDRNFDYIKNLHILSLEPDIPSAISMECNKRLAFAFLNQANILINFCEDDVADEVFQLLEFAKAKFEFWRNQYPDDENYTEPLDNINRLISNGTK